MSNDTLSSEPKIKHITLGLIIGWIVGVFFGIPGIMMLFQHKVGAGIFLILAALVAFPPANTFMKKKTNFSLSGGVRVVLIVILFAIAAALLSQGDPTASTVSSGSNGISAPSAPTPQSTTFKVGQPITLGSSVLTVNKVEVTQGGEFITPSSGNEFVNLNLTIQNTGNTEQDVTTLGQMFIRDAGGNSYQVTTTDVTEQNMSDDLDGAVIANSKRTGWVGFEVPAGDKGLQFQYDASIFGGGTALVNLGQ